MFVIFFQTINSTIFFIIWNIFLDSISFVSTPMFITSFLDHLGFAVSFSGSLRGNAGLFIGSLASLLRWAFIPLNFPFAVVSVLPMSFSVLCFLFPFF